MVVVLLMVSVVLPALMGLLGILILTLKDGGIGHSETKDTKIVALRLKFNAFKAIEREKVNGAFIRLRSLLNDLENNGVLIPQAEESDSDIEEDQRSNSKFLADLNAEFHERALLASQRRFYKRSGRVGPSKKPLDKTNETCFACGKLGHYQKECPSIKTSTPQYPSSSRLYNKPKYHTNPTHHINQNVNHSPKNYRVKYKGLKAEITVPPKKINAMNKGKRVTTFKALMVVADEPSIGRADARSGQWVEITMNKTNPKIPSYSESEGNTQRPLPTLPKPLGVKPSCKRYISLPKTTQTADKVIFVNIKQETETESPLDPSTKKLLLNMMKEAKKSPHRGMFKKPKCSTYGSADHLTKENLEQTMVKRTLVKHNAQGSSRKDTMIPKPYIPCKYCGFNDHHSDEYEFYPGCDLCGSIAHKTTNCGEAINTACYTQNRSIIVKRHRKTAYDVFRGRSPDISYFHVFGCPMHIHNHKDHLGKFDEKADDGFFLGYSPVAKAFRVFNIIRQEMKETYHVTFSEDDETISQSSIEADAINFNAIRFFPDDEFQELRRKPNKESGNNKHIPYVPAHDPLSSNNISIPECLNSADSHKAQDSVSPEDHAETSKTNNDQVLNEPNHHESAKNLEHAKVQTSVLNEQCNTPKNACRSGILYGDVTS
nr:retrovirus-related Pol polyprotein from transposon TNT 1-94 [Tanacetum cinerariifolium]